MKTRLIVVSAVAVVALFLTASAYAQTCTGSGDACADLSFIQKNVGGIGEVNILFGAGGVGPAGPDFTIMGHTVNHGVGSFEVDFMSSGKIFSSGGQSDVDPCNDPEGTVPADCVRPPVGTQVGHIHDLTITVPGSFFHDLITDPQLVGTVGDLHAIVTLEDGEQATFGPYGKHTTGQNFLTIQTTDPAAEIKSVDITSTSGYDDFKQPRISGIGGLTLTPEPSSMLMLGSGVVGLAGLLRRKLLHPPTQGNNKTTGVRRTVTA